MEPSDQCNAFFGDQTLDVLEELNRESELQLTTKIQQLIRENSEGSLEKKIDGKGGAFDGILCCGKDDSKSDGKEGDKDGKDGKDKDDKGHDITSMAIIGNEANLNPQEWNEFINNESNRLNELIKTKKPII